MKRTDLILLSTLTLALLSPAQALVDYTETTPSQPRVKRNSPAPARRIAPKVNTSTQAQSSSSNGASLGLFNIQSMYHSMKVEGESGQSDIQKMKLHALFQTHYNLFVDADYDFYQSSDEEVGTSGDWQAGRGKALLGFNWLQFGSVADLATIDLIGGIRSSSSSDLASSRLDKIVGVETTKRFYQFAVGFGYELWLTGTPDSEEEMKIGNVSLLKASLGWVVSRDIRFSLEGATVSISKASDSDEGLKLDKDIKYSYVSPMLSLGLSPFVNVNMGATFRTRRAKDVQRLVPAKLWELPGLYGNTLFAGIEFSI